MLSLSLIQNVLDASLSQGGSWSDLFLEETTRQVISLSDQSLKNLSATHRLGAGLRVVASGQEYYGYTSDLSETSLIRLARELASMIRLGSSCFSQTLQPKIPSWQNVVHKKPSDIGWAEKIALVRRADEAARKVSPSIVQVNAGYQDEIQNVWIANSDGLWTHETRTRGRLNIATVAEHNGEKQMAHEGPGSLSGFEFFESLDIEAIATDTAQTSLRMVQAPHAPQGTMTVLINSGFGGVIFHEACGHSLEASAVAKKATVFADKLGQTIAHSAVSAVDDGTLSGEWGSSGIDDEGTPTQRNLLIDKGVLRSFLVDRLNGERLELKSTGSARRENFQYPPTSRMNNTFILPGTSTLASMIAETENGFYAAKLGGGSVNPATGEFNFAVTEGYAVHNGKLGNPMKGAVLIGRGDLVLQNIDLVGSELKLAQGMCGAASGWVPVNVGQPPLRVRNILVGGQG
jgi:TldD protein